ncbi:MULTISPECIES: YbaK/EbsC family protein [unclassified Kitasatospora]|uniref:YbaK/EbsC family protein n=1 Tax=unclassified Kitasatospora TaxID=2633591 RepID=UPI003404DF7A
MTPALSTTSPTTGGRPTGIADSTDSTSTATGVLTSTSTSTEPATEPSTYSRLLGLLATHPAAYRTICHEPEGNTALASELRGHPLEQAAKSIVIRAKRTKQDGGGRYALAVVPGDRRVDLDAVGQALGSSRVGFADRTTAERLSGCVTGSIIPFSFHPDLELLVDHDLLAHSHLYFNAARLDRSIELRTAVYRTLAQPQVLAIAA